MDGKNENGERIEITSVTNTFWQKYTWDNWERMGMIDLILVRGSMLRDVHDAKTVRS